MMERVIRDEWNENYFPNYINMKYVFEEEKLKISN